MVFQFDIKTDSDVLQVLAASVITDTILYYDISLGMFIHASRNTFSGQVFLNLENIVQRT